MTPEQMRARFHELGNQREKILAESTPLRQVRDAIVREVEPRIKELERQFKKIEEPLFDLDMERAALARALKGKTGDK